ncbi:hypothetical protein ACFRK5_34555 [Streptomyces niveus]|uniref:hypothetical protein n=1 Tax=Streptomyces niveus TaxID=193462 RepID=UPI00367C60E1
MGRTGWSLSDDAGHAGDAEVEVRRHGESAVAIGVQSQQSVVDGRDADGRFRATQFLVKDRDGGGIGDGWRLVGIHLSALAEQLP